MDIEEELSKFLQHQLQEIKKAKGYLSHHDSEFLNKVALEKFTAASFQKLRRMFEVTAVKSPQFSSGLRVAMALLDLYMTVFSAKDGTFFKKEDAGFAFSDQALPNLSFKPRMDKRIEQRGKSLGSRPDSKAGQIGKFIRNNFSQEPFTANSVLEKILAEGLKFTKQDVSNAVSQLRYDKSAEKVSYGMYKLTSSSTEISPAV